MDLDLYFETVLFHLLSVISTYAIHEWNFRMTLNLKRYYIGSWGTNSVLNWAFLHFDSQMGLDTSSRIYSKAGKYDIPHFSDSQMD